MTVSAHVLNDHQTEFTVDFLSAIPYRKAFVCMCDPTDDSLGFVVPFMHHYIGCKYKL